MHITTALAKIEHVRDLWRDRKATSIAAAIKVDREVLDDQEMVARIVEHDLSTRLDEHSTLLAWRLADARWALINAARAARGRHMLPTGYSDTVSIMMSTEGPDYMERGLVKIIGERTRVRRPL